MTLQRRLISFASSAPPAVADHRNAPVNALGYLRVMFAVDDIEDTLQRLRKHGAQLVGEVVQYEDAYRLCYIRGARQGLDLTCSGSIVVALHPPPSALKSRTRSFDTAVSLDASESCKVSNDRCASRTSLKSRRPVL